MGEAYHSVLQISKILGWENMSRMGVDGGGSLCTGGLIQEGHEDFGEGEPPFFSRIDGKGHVARITGALLAKSCPAGQVGAGRPRSQWERNRIGSIRESIRLTERARE